MPMTFVLFQVAHENCGSIEISEDELFREIALAMSTSGVINWEYKKYILLRFKYGLIQVFLPTSCITIFKYEFLARIISRGRDYEF